jgi:hypothetical protein
MLLPEQVLASVSRAVSIAELTRASHQVLVGDPVEASSRWETTDGQRRIVTYTRVLVNESVLGSGDTELMVRTLGGRVGKIGQIVHGEAALRVNERSLLFLHGADSGVVRVTAMAQGHYRLSADDRGIKRLRPSPHLGHLLKAQGAAVQRLEGRTLREARDLIIEADQR